MVCWKLCLLYLCCSICFCFELSWTKEFMCTLLWYNFSSPEPVPGPGSYNPHVYRTSSKRCAPAFTMSRTPREIGITQNCTFWGKECLNYFVETTGSTAPFLFKGRYFFTIKTSFIWHSGLAFDIRRGVAVHLLLMQCALCFSISISIFLNNHDIGVTIHIMWKKFSVLSAFLDHFNTETIFS